MNVVQFGNSMQPQKNEVTQDEAKPQVVVLTEKAICVQGTDRVGTTSQGYLELSSWKGWEGFPWNHERWNLQTLCLESPVIVHHTATARTTHRHLDLTQLHWYLGGKRFWCDCSSHGVT